MYDNGCLLGLLHVMMLRLVHNIYDASAQCRVSSHCITSHCFELFTISAVMHVQGPEVWALPIDLWTSTLTFQIKYTLQWWSEDECLYSSDEELILLFLLRRSKRSIWALLFFSCKCTICFQEIYFPYTRLSFSQPWSAILLQNSRKAH